MSLWSRGGPEDGRLRPGRAQLGGLSQEQRQGGELQNAGNCCGNISIDKSMLSTLAQVVSGTIYRFDLLSSGDRHSCLTADLMSCHMSVYSQPWTDTLQVNWDSSTCDKAERKRSNHKSKNKQLNKDVEVNILPGGNASGNDCNDADGNKGKGLDFQMLKDS